MPADTDQPTLAVTSQGQADARAYLLARCVATDQRSITVSKSLLEIACADTRTHFEPRPVAGSAAKALFDHEMAMRGVVASWDDVDAHDRAGWQSSVDAVLSAARPIACLREALKNLRDRAEDVSEMINISLLDTAIEKADEALATGDDWSHPLPASPAATISPGATSLEGGEGVAQRCATIAECAFDDRPRSRVGHPSQMDWDDGFRDGTRAAAAAIRAAHPSTQEG